MYVSWEINSKDISCLFWNPVFNFEILFRDYATASQAPGTSYQLQGNKAAVYSVAANAAQVENSYHTIQVQLIRLHCSEQWTIWNCK
jgi:alpha-D-ribose 1-methylphosphonate 5-triphosphate synthase subunit PhnH